ncbi:MAG: tRNA (N6-threonylcarbamoyladenosine(37)-N6)-methyltransferase TrmO [Bacteroidota bacterium]|nr:tRNA (N6-threonylcarbamoyladenosine(37)-N6)-methyltransferase TrmO [Bacteroidota bacterium]MDP4260678.1 tRNA (N6-threonylcarbamoyladenosine(37)-N6)-methyltransferase TrmO [Bacteroidota bacterium]
MRAKNEFALRVIGYVRSEIRRREDSPRQGKEGAPDAWLELDDTYLPALDGIVAGDELILLTWFHLSDREVQQVHPRGDVNNPMMGVFGTRSPDRPNPIGLHPVRVLELSGNRMKVGPLEAVDGTPVVDIKPVI